MKKISVIVPIYYGKNYIDDMIKQIDIASGNIKNFIVELIIVNDTPDEIIEGYSSEKNYVKIINLGYNQGIHGARVKGLESSSGEYILFLDQDDKISPLYFVSQLNKLKTNDAVVCLPKHWKNLGLFDKESFTTKIQFEKFIGEGNMITSPGQVLIKKEAIPKTWINNIMRSNGADDWFLWICMMKLGCTFAVNDDELFEHVLHEHNESHNELNMSKSEQEMNFIIKEKGILSSEEQKQLDICIKNIFYQRVYVLEKTKKKLKLYEKWLDLHRKGKYISDFCKKSHIKSVSIYGAADVGQQIYRELSLNNIIVDKFIDRKGYSVYDTVPVVKLEEYLFESDLIIISVIDFDKSIKEYIKKYNKDVRSIEEIIDELLKNE